MANNQTEKNKQTENNDEALAKPDPETLHTTDPQEHMEGPVSSLVKKTAEEGDDEDRVEKDSDKGGE